MCKPNNLVLLPVLRTSVLDPCLDESVSVCARGCVGGVCGVCRTGFQGFESLYSIGTEDPDLCAWMYETNILKVISNITSRSLDTSMFNVTLQ